MSHPLLQIRLEAGYGKHSVLQDVELDLRAGESLGLVGTSGAGKSTLVLALMGLLSWRKGWTRGKVLLNGSDILSMKERDVRAIRGRQIALVPQSPLSALNSAVSLRGHFEEAWRAHQKSSPDRLNQRLRELMEQMHLPTQQPFLERKPSEISVGQAQRVVIALALLHRPALLIADEPTSALDPATQVDVLDLLRRANTDTGTSLLYISHDLLSVLQLCQRMAVLERGRIVECLSVDRIEEQAKSPATLALLSTLPVPPAVLRQHSRLPALPMAQDEPTPEIGPPQKSAERNNPERTSAVLLS